MSFPRYPKYKDSGVEWLGEVPESWSVHSLRHHLDAVFNGLTAIQIDESEETVPVTRIETISRGVIDYDRVGHISVEDARQDRLLIKGDILFSNINSLNMIGNCAKHDGNTILYAGMNLLVLRPIEGVSSDWLFWVIRSSTFRQMVESYAKPAINQASISQNSLLSIFIASPSIGEQQAIAAFLDRETAKIDALVAEQENLIALLKEKRQAVISRAVTKGLDPTVPMKDSGIEWLGEVPAHWRQTPIKFTLHAIIDTEHKTVPFYEDGEYLVVRTTNIKNGKLVLDGAKYTDLAGYLEWTKRGIPAVGDILFTREAPAGEACLVPPDIKLCVGQRTVTLSVDQTKLLPKFGLWSLYGGISAKFISDLSQGSTVAHFNMSDIGNIPLMLPDTEEQKAIAGFLDRETAKLDTLTTEAQHTIDLLKERRSALISAAVTGKIDVRGYHVHSQPIT